MAVILESEHFLELDGNSEVLRYYDSIKPLVIQVDVSQRGLVAALPQANDPIAFASKSLTEKESRYSNIEREMMGIVFGLERFHHTSKDATWKCIRTTNRLNPSTPNISTLPHQGWRYSAYNSTT